MPGVPGTVPGTAEMVVYIPDKRLFSLNLHFSERRKIGKSKYVLGWPKPPFSFFHKIKDTSFIFTSNFIDLDILSMSAISCYWVLVGRGQGCC